MKKLREERGAVAIVAAIVTSTCVTMTALGVDIGAAAFEKRDLQKVVDLAALDALRELTQPRLTIVGTRSDRALHAARDSATRNDFDWANTSLGNDLRIELGIGDRTTRTFTALSPGADESTANAVRVIARTYYDYRFAPGGLGLEVDAVAVGLRAPPTSPPASPSPCPSPCTTTTTNPVNDGLAEIMVGSRVARFRSADAPLLNNTLAGLGFGPVNLDLAGYEGLAVADVTLGDLWLKLGFGSPDEIMNGEVTYGEMIDATIDALNAEGSGVNAQAVLALEQIRASSGGGFDPSLTYQFGDIVNFGTSTPGRAAFANLKVLDLLMMGAEAANKESLVSIDIPHGQIPGVASGTVKITFIEPPQMDAGPAEQDASGAWVTHAETAQARVKITLRLEDQLAVNLITGPIDVPLYIDAGRAEADLTAIDCSLATGSDLTTVPVRVHGRTSALNAYVGAVTDASMTNPNIAPTVTRGVLSELSTGARIYGYSEAAATGSEQVFDFVGPFESRIGSMGASGMGVTLGANLQVEAENTLGAADALVLVTDAKAKVVYTLSLIDAALLAPLGGALGITLAGADVSNPAVDCFDPVLIK